MSLEIVMGPMFAGKTTYIIRTAREYIEQGLQVLIVKPSIDTRSGVVDLITTHDGDSFPCYTTNTLNGLTSEFLAPYNVVILEEAQFFKGLVPFAEYAVDTLHKIVYFVGLAGDSDRRPFGEFLNAIPMADTVTQLTARCLCGETAFFTRRLFSGFPQVAIGGSELYTPQCRYCYVYK